MITQEDIEFYRDGYHTYKELYHDAVLALCNSRKRIDELQCLLDQAESFSLDDENDFRRDLD